MNCVGDLFITKNGKAKVVSVDAGNIIAEYIDGVQIGNRFSLSGMSAGATASNSQKSKSSAGNRFRFPEPLGELTTLQINALLYLAEHARFDAEVPDSQTPSFEAKYSALAQTPVRPPQYIVIDSDNKWAPELRIYFPEPRFPLLFPNGIRPVSSTQYGVLRINNNAFWWQLIVLGFRLGTAHDVARIKKELKIS